ncbi:hypothetical protein QL996_05110 [Planococcus sp. APC 4015]|nr:hypothetical protein [Planococcus sp. APC 4015]
MGHSLFELASGGLLWGLSGQDLQRAAQETARELKRTGGPLAHSPDLPQTILSLLGDANFSLVETIQVASDADPMTVAHVFPSALLSARLERPLTETTPKFADAHMHSGATLSLEALLELGLSADAEFPKELRDVVTYDRFGQQFSLGAIFVATVRVLQYRLAERVEGATSVSPVIRAAIARDAFWREVNFVAGGAPDGKLDEDAVTWEDLASRPSGIQQLPVDVTLEIRALLDDLFSHGAHARVALGFVQALLLINGFLRSDHGEGLSAFVARFARVSSFRKIASGAQRERTLARAVEDVFGGGVLAAEFRKTVDEDAGRNLQAEVLNELTDHLVAFASSGSFEVHPRGVAMPVSYRRSVRAPVPSDPESIGLIHPIDQHLALARTIADIVERWPNLGPLIGAVDVVGNELDEPNWAYVPVLDELCGRVGERLVRTSHAGEHFMWPIQGIRSVGELIRPSRVVDRIGHALALDPTCADFITGAAKPVYDARSVLDDVCWLVGVGHANDDVVAFAHRLLGWLGMQERGLGLVDFVAAWEARRTVGGMSEYLGFGTGESFTPPLEIQLAYARSLSGPALALTLMLYQGRAPGFEAMDKPLPSGLAAEYGRINDTLSPILADAVVGWVVEEGIVIEACPTSNLTLAGLPRPKYLPIGGWLSRGVVVTVSSDDPTHFSTRIEDELEVLRPILSSSDLSAVVKSSLHYCCQLGGQYDGEQMRRLASAATEGAWASVAV